MCSTSGFLAGSGFRFCLVLNDSGGGEHISIFVIGNKMNEITHALFYGIEKYINDFKSRVTRACTLQSLHECLCVRLGKFGR